MPEIRLKMAPLGRKAHILTIFQQSYGKQNEFGREGRLHYRLHEGRRRASYRGRSRQDPGLLEAGGRSLHRWPRHLRSEDPRREDGAKPAHGRDHPDQGDEGPEVPGIEDSERRDQIAFSF